MVAALVLFAVALAALVHDRARTTRTRALGGRERRRLGVTPGQVFGTLDWLLVAACTAPFILTWIIARGHALTWQPGEVTMIVGITAFVLIL